MSNLRETYTKLLTDNPAQTLDALVSRYQLARTALDVEYNRKTQNYNILLPRDNARTTLQQHVSNEMRDHYSALDEVFYKLTRNLEVIEAPQPLREMPVLRTSFFSTLSASGFLTVSGLQRLTEGKALIVVQREINECPKLPRLGRLAGQRILKEATFKHYKSLFWGDFWERYKTEWIQPEEPHAIGNFRFLLGFQLSWIAFGTILLINGGLLVGLVGSLFILSSLIFNFAIIHLHYQKTEEAICEDAKALQEWLKEKEEYELQLATYEERCFVQEARLKTIMQEARNAPPEEEQTARIDL